MSEPNRQQIDRAIDAGQYAAAVLELEALWRQSPSGAVAAFVVSRFETLRGRWPLVCRRLAILRSFTVEPIVPLLRALAFVGGIDLDIRLGDFGAYAQDILADAGWLQAFAPDAVILAVQARDIAPSLWNDFADLTGEQVERAADDAASALHRLIDAFRARHAAHLVVHNLQRPHTPARGIFDAQGGRGQADALMAVNAQLKAAAASHRNVYLLDYDGLVARHGDHWHDARKWVTARLPIASQCLIHLAREWMKFLHPMSGRICKVAAVDLDNTLWGGVIGEEGPAGIKLDDGWPGAAYRSVQRALLDLHRRGILLAVCSKNNPAEALDALQNHPHMLLRPEHFAAIYANWNDKAANLQAIAKELNVGQDAVAFIDDNPVERQWVRQQLPQVTVIDLPEDPSQYSDIIRDAPVFQRLELTAEDQTRGELYAQQRQRARLQQQAGSLEDFYRSLQMRATVSPISEATVPRAAQLTQKTNQFNLTTRRYSEQQLAQALASPRTRGFTLQTADRFGDNGIVGVAVLVLQDDGACDIDVLLLSCRVIGRTLETAFLSALAAEARALGAARLTGDFLPTRKNAPCRDFYRQHEFTCVKEEADGTAKWELDLSAKLPACPPWIQLERTPERGRGHFSDHVS